MLTFATYTPLTKLLKSKRPATRKMAQSRAAKTEELRKEIALRDFTQWATIRRESTKEGA